MYEVEVKVRADHDGVRTALDEHAVERIDAVVQTDTYYDAPHRSFAETDEALRIRREEPVAGGEPTTVVTYKGPLVDDSSKTRREIETAIADADDADAILTALGFDPAATVRKERERYSFGEFTVTLDDVTGLGEFVEIETEVTENEVSTASDRAHELLAELGLDPESGIRRSYLGLLLDEEE